MAERTNTGRVVLTAVSIYMGVIQVINKDGSIGFYAQRGIKKLKPDEQAYAIENGIINPKAFSLRELPRNYSVRFEDSCMGRPVVNFNKDWLYNI